MFNAGNWKQKAGLMGLGSVFTIIGMLFAIRMFAPGTVQPVTAQRDKFGDIECTSLKVVDADGIARVILSTHIVDVLPVDENMEKVIVHGSTAFGTRVMLYDKDGRMVDIRSKNDLSDGGIVAVHGKDGKSSASLRIVENGGCVAAIGNDRKWSAWLGFDVHGGRVQVDGEGEAQVAIRIDERGNGAVSTWDKNGYRQ